METLAVCPKCNGSGRIAPDESGYDGCDQCNYGEGPTGFVPRTMALKEIAQAFANAFEQRTRDNGEQFYALRDGSPEWMKDACMAAHADGAMLPDDWRYRMIASVARELADREPENWDDESHEAIDGLVSIYNHELLDWLASHGSRVDYADSAVDEGLVSASAGILQRAQAGQYQEYREIWVAIVEALRERAED